MSSKACGMLSITGTVGSSHGNFGYGVGIGILSSTAGVPILEGSLCQTNHSPLCCQIPSVSQCRDLSLSGHSLAQYSPPFSLAVQQWEDVEEEEEDTRSVSSISVRGFPTYLFGNLPSDKGRTLQCIKHGETNPVCHPHSLVDLPTIAKL